MIALTSAIMAGIGNATKFSILNREGDALERLSGIKRIVFDKTGTLNYGKPDVAAVKSFDPALTDQELLSLAASAELRSEHPLGKAIVAHFKAVSKPALPEPRDFQMLAGRGGRSAQADGRAILAGNAELLRDYSIPLPQHPGKGR